ncbi:MAG: zinc ABC transporter substrate-binding protein [Bifidobacterium sp.]|jgi:zinc/manganese transport system substrate-binding protein|nr:zinc ABC transporter substrate-binding protein [Bifidobacterium sp.]MCH4210022.1 zinc ABC transporter substrate-binding protein [Bifidobacterium sp.]MCI1225414.1 zinc ABC transporter substrate-binding protein [Bifidobacterium sp.]
MAAAATGAMALTVAACGGSDNASGSDAPKDGGTISVVASINQWASVAKDLGGSHVDVSSIMSNTNVEAHDYEPTTSDVAKISKAEVIVVNGADYDPWALKAAESAGATVVNAAEAGGVKEGDNPHVWFSAAVRRATADAITKAYQAADAKNRDEYATLNSTWQQGEQRLEDKIAAAAKTTKGLPYAATESVAWYLAGDLQMTDDTPKGYAQASANESEPTPADIKDFQNALGDGSIKLLVFNTQEADATTDQLVSAAKSGNVPIIELTEQMPKEYDNLLDWMGALVDKFDAAV